MTSVTLLTCYSPDWKQLVDITLPNWRAYCRKHGYSLIANSKNPSDLFYGWQRLEDLYDYLFVYSLAEVIMLLDADIVITNPEITVESLMDDVNDFYITQDVNGINAGATIWRATKWTERFLTKLLGDRKKFTGDQDAIAHHLPKHMKHSKILPQSTMNSYINSEYIESQDRTEGDWKKGDFILHFPALSMKRRIELATEYVCRSSTTKAILAT